MSAVPDAGDVEALRSVAYEHFDEADTHMGRCYLEADVLAMLAEVRRETAERPEGVSAQDCRDVAKWLTDEADHRVRFFPQRRDGVDALLRHFARLAREEASRG